MNNFLDKNAVYTDQPKHQNKKVLAFILMLLYTNHPSKHIPPHGSGIPHWLWVPCRIVQKKVIKVSTWPELIHGMFQN